MKFFLFTLLFAQTALACEVTLPDTLLVLGQDIDSSPLAAKDCGEGTVTDLRRILAEVEGRVGARQISELLEQRGHSGISVSPTTVHIKQLRTSMREQINLPPGVQVKAVRAQYTQNLVPLTAGDSIEVDCSSCLFGQAQPLRVLIRAFDGSSRTIMANADFRKMVRAYKFMAPIASFTNLGEAVILKEVFVEDAPHTDLVTDLSQARFFKTNKPLRAGDLLRHADLNPINLVRAGQKTEVVLENTMIRIKTHGISRGNGGVGDQVEIFHQQKNKKYLGKIIDHNKVLVEL